MVLVFYLHHRKYTEESSVHVNTSLSSFINSNVFQIPTSLGSDFLFIIFIYFLIIFVNILPSPEMTQFWWHRSNEIPTTRF